MSPNWWFKCLNEPLKPEKPAITLGQNPKILTWPCIKNWKWKIKKEAKNFKYSSYGAGLKIRIKNFLCTHHKGADFNMGSMVTYACTKTQNLNFIPRTISQGYTVEVILYSTCLNFSAKEFTSLTDRLFFDLILII